MTIMSYCVYNLLCMKWTDEGHLEDKTFGKLLINIIRVSIKLHENSKFQ